MSFDDILDDIFDFDDVAKPQGDVTAEETNSGLWDSGSKENVWRSADPKANGVWDAGISGDPAGCSDPDCGGCSDPDCDIDDEDNYIDDDIFDEDETIPDPMPEPPPDTSGGLFDDFI